MALAGLQYLFEKVTLPIHLVEQIFLNQVRKRYSDLQLFYVSVALDDDHGREGIPKDHRFAGSYTLRPQSRGYVTLRSKDPEDPPLIHPNYFPNNWTCRHKKWIGVAHEIFMQEGYVV